MSAPTTSTASPVLNAIARGLYDLLNGAFALDQIDKTVGTIWYHYSKGELTDDEATFLANVADKRRPLGRRTFSAPGVAKNLWQPFAVAWAAVSHRGGRLGRPIVRNRSSAVAVWAVPALCLTPSASITLRVNAPGSV